ncbi:hypothetical protein GOP47_0021898 [Adiantum capillus-veneris]|uniref:Dirigent protein n=1 Tax=Adiantum capillus-veneris TaxID=13818 RepID=A0A9D4U8A4_ADICA|nr:hypothetical protein GOP47_0021898 [Adiantum capillus-veneris]
MVWNPLLNNTDYFNSVYSAPPPNITFPNPTFFGVTSTFEDPLTIGPSNDSLQIGTAHGFYFFDSLRDFTLFHIFTANITEGDYLGTLDVFGQVREIDPIRYLTVIGGTGDFMLARGLATCTLIELYRGPPGAARWTLFFDLDLYY